MGWGGGLQISYFDTSGSGFPVVGGIALLVYLFVAVAMLQCDQHRRPELFVLLWKLFPVSFCPVITVLFTLAPFI